MLLLADGTPIIDSRVIADYLDSLGTPSLYPLEPQAALQMRSACALWSGTLAQAVEIFAPAAKLDTPLPATLLDWHQSKIAATLAHMETHADLTNPNQLAMVDLFFVATVGFIDYRLSDLIRWRENCPQLAAYFDALHVEHAVIETTKPQD